MRMILKPLKSKFAITTSVWTAFSAAACTDAQMSSVGGLSLEDFNQNPSAATTDNHFREELSIALEPALGNLATEFQFKFASDIIAYSQLKTLEFKLDQVGVTCNPPVVRTDESDEIVSVYVTGCSGDGSVSVVVSLSEKDESQTFISESAIIDNTPPKIAIGEPSSVAFGPEGSVQFIIEYERPPLDLSAADIEIGGNAKDCTLEIVGRETERPIVVLESCSTAGLKSISVAPGTSIDDAGNADAGAGPSDFVLLDLSEPWVSITRLESGPANAMTPATFSLSYVGGVAPYQLESEMVSTVSTGDVICAPPVIENKTTASPLVRLSNCQGNGSVGIRVAEGAVANAVGNRSSEVISAYMEIDNIPSALEVKPPTVTLISSSQVVDFPLIYENLPIGLSASDINLTGASAGCTVEVLEGESLRPAVRVSGCTGDGELSISVAPGKSRDESGNSDQGASSPESVLVDNTPPSVTFGAPSVSSVSAALVVSYQLSYEEAPLGFSESDLTLHGENAGCSLSLSDSASKNPIVTISECTGDGELSISVSPGLSSDSAGNKDLGVGPSLPVSIDNTAPVVSIGVPNVSSISSSGSVTFNLSYEVAPLALTANDVTVNGSSAGCFVSLSNESTTSPAVEVSGCSDNGTISIGLAAGTSSDSAGNADFGVAASDSVTVDNVPPTVAIGAPSRSSFNTTETVSFALTYEIVPVDLNSSHITITGDSTDCVITVINPASTTPSVEITGCSVDGPISISVASGLSSDDAANSDLGAGPSTEVNVYNGIPLVNISSPSLSSASSGDNVTFDIEYTNASTLNGISASNITLNTTGSVNCVAPPTLTNGSTATPSVSLSHCFGNGTLSITVAADVVRNSSAAGNIATTSETFNVSNMEGLVWSLVNRSSPYSNEIWNPDNTTHASYSRYYSHTAPYQPNPDLWSYSQGTNLVDLTNSGGVFDFGDWEGLFLHIWATKVVWSGDEAETNVEFLDAANSVLGAFRIERLSTYSSRLRWGSNLSNLTNTAPYVGPHPVIDYYLIFESDKILFRTRDLGPIGDITHGQSIGFDFPIPVSDIARLRVTGLRAKSTYASNGTAYTIGQIDAQPSWWDTWTFPTFEDVKSVPGQKMIITAVHTKGATQLPQYNPTTSPEKYLPLRRWHTGDLPGWAYRNNGGAVSIRNGVFSAFDKNARYRIEAHRGYAIGDSARGKLEFLDANGNVVAALEARESSSYSTTLWYGPTLSNLTMAPSVGSYPKVDGYLTFTDTHMTFENLRSEHYSDDFTLAADFASVVKIRYSDVNAYNTYSSGYCHFVFWMSPLP